MNDMLSEMAALERQWAAVVLRRPSLRHVLLKWAAAYQIGPELAFTDERARLVYQGVIRLVYQNQPVTPQAVADHVARYAFDLDAASANQFIAELLDSSALDVDVERLAVRLLDAKGIHLPDDEVNETLTDPYGLRAEKMKSRKVRARR
jgi:hypothetical protein